MFVWPASERSRDVASCIVFFVVAVVLEGFGAPASFLAFMPARRFTGRCLLSLVLAAAGLDTGDAFDERIRRFFRRQPTDGPADDAEDDDAQQKRRDELAQVSVLFGRVRSSALEWPPEALAEVEAAALRRKSGAARSSNLAKSKVASQAKAAADAAALKSKLGASRVVPDWAPRKEGSTLDVPAPVDSG